MGMGEPLDNFDAIKQTLEVLTEEWGLGWSPHRLTVSTVGITPMLKRLLDETQCHVAVSMHNAFGEERAKMMPLQKAYPIADVVELLKQYNWYGQRRISFEYTMFKGINDDLNHAAEIVKLVKGLHCRVNLIRFHSSPEVDYKSSDERTMMVFRDYLDKHGITCTIRASRGEDIMAACGLLAGQK
jgi:23S rRNA (adenine2503-C2)-methyltransferase